MRSRPHVIVAGNIGSGKAATAAALADELGLALVRQPTDDNPYLAAYYRHRRRWAFHSQVQFLSSGVAQHQRIRASSGGAVQVQSVYEQFHVFTQELGGSELSSDEFAILADLYYAVESMLPAPDLLVYLDAPPDELLRRIKARDHRESRFIDAAYLGRLDSRYRAFLDTWRPSPVLRVDARRFDSACQSDIDSLAERVMIALDRSP